jgi:hypothetical protein
MIMDTTIKIYLKCLGLVLTGSGIFWFLRDLFIADHDRWTWFSRLLAGAIVLGISALIPDKR